MEKVRIGTIEKFENGFYAVRLENEPLHLSVEFLRPFQVARDLKVGDRVRLTYRTSPSSGLFFASKAEGESL